MDILEFLKTDEEGIVDEALPAVRWLEHYGRDGEGLARERVRTLCRLVADAIASRDLEALLAHATRIARERRAAGYDRSEVASAFSAVEEAIWHRALTALDPGEQAWGLALVGTALAHARDVLGRAFTEDGTASAFVDLTPVFRGAPAGRDRFRDDLVHPV